MILRTPWRLFHDGEKTVIVNNEGAVICYVPDSTDPRIAHMLCVTGQMVDAARVFLGSKTVAERNRARAMFYDLLSRT